MGGLQRRALRLGLVALVAGMTLQTSAAAATDGGSEAEAERAIQAYLAMWSRDADIDATSVSRFYAPRVVYYGKSFGRAQILKDKLAYIRIWPERHYREVPGTFAAHCNGGRRICRVSIDMAWRRVGRHHVVSTGRARLTFDFIPVDGGRKIARESARIL